MFAAKMFLALLLTVQPMETEEQLVFVHQGKPVHALPKRDIVLPGVGYPAIHLERLPQLAKQLAHTVYHPPVNAYIDDRGVIVEGVKGWRLNETAFEERLIQAFLTSGTTNVEMPLIAEYPRVTAELLKMLTQKKISRYITYYNPKNENRAHNISLAARAINNVVLFPGEVFSFNKVVGRRTKQKGYREAPIIVRGELSEGVGGGICQVSSTLYNAVDQAGLHIVARYSHSKRVPYVPPKRDATVSWGGPDFQFQNRYAFPVLIRAVARHGVMLVELYSDAELDYEPRKIPPASKEVPEEEEKPAIQ